MKVFPTNLFAMSWAGRFEQLIDLYAPRKLDENGEPTGERCPGEGIITREQFLALLDKKEDQ